LEESARAEERGETLFRSLERRKALKGKAPERRELREASRGKRAKDPVERVAKPESGASGRKGKTFQTPTEPRG
jgi:hypothetical protein